MVPLRIPRSLQTLPPHVYFVVSAIFHYLGPSFAVLLFASIPVLGVAWLRIASAGLIFAVWRRPWRIWPQLSRSQRWTLVALGIVLGCMNATFYMAIARLPLSTVGAIEFIGPIVLAAVGVRTPRNVFALLCAAAGGWVLTDVRLSGEPLGYLLAFGNCALFVLYIILGHRIAQDGGVSSIDQLGLAMLIALVMVSPLGFTDAVGALQAPVLVFAGIAVGICSSVIPYICDQLAMARLSRATFALLLALLPASATLIGVLVLRQIPSGTEILGIALVAVGVALHRTRTSGAVPANDAP
jgi:inner membrane transporter RhtA